MLFLYYNLFEFLESLTNICVFGSFSVSSSIFIKKIICALMRQTLKAQMIIIIYLLIPSYRDIYMKLLYFRSFTFGKVSISAGIPEAV